ncbi:glycoside hydrolase family 18 protein, partial [Mycena metata]
MARFSFLASIVSVLLALPLVPAVPVSSDARLGKRAEGLSAQAREVLSHARAIDVSTAAPQFVAYFDKFVSYDSLPDPSLLTGFTVFALAFVYPSSAVDNAQVWESMTAADRATTKAEYNAAGISLIVSAFGSGSSPTSQDPTTVANYIANYVLTYNLDGVDIDYEDFPALESAGTAVPWLSTLTTVLRQKLPKGQYILTHAPVAPWFSPGLWPGNGYLGVNAAVGSLIDWYNVQFYNQGDSEYVTCAGLLTASSSTWPESALFQIATNGVPLNKLVIGKGATGADATTGYMDPATLATCVAQAKSQGWSAGVMEWQYPNGGSAWIEEVRADSWPVGGGGVTTTSSTTSTKTH